MCRRIYTITCDGIVECDVCVNLAVAGCSSKDEGSLSKASSGEVDCIEQLGVVLLGR